MFNFTPFSLLENFQGFPHTFNCYVWLLQQLLLSELHETQMCNRLLVPEADEDVHWTDRRTISGRSAQDSMHSTAYDLGQQLFGEVVARGEVGFN